MHKPYKVNETIPFPPLSEPHSSFVLHMLSLSNTAAHSGMVSAA